jgi:GH15 family glucan-1,4-alpha-glucosidase
MYPFGLIGNCQTSALISRHGSIEWLCLPRPDSPPVFGKILDPEGGEFSIGAVDPVQVRHVLQRYIQNTNVLHTRIEIEDGSSFQITDFCPRFQQHGRMYRPLAIFRIVEPIEGTPSIRVSCKPVSGWGREPVKPIRGSSHLRFEVREASMRLTSTMPLTYLLEQTPFALTGKIYFALTWDVGLEDDLTRTAEDFLNQTADHWRTWVKHCSIPSLYQQETVRSALALKLHCYEDTGGILAALTTSLPEQPGQGRNWDYRFCWLRDAYFVLSAFYALGHFEEMEGFLRFLINVAHQHERSPDRLHPVYSLNQGTPIPEIVHANWRGYRGCQPVRSNNQAAEHVQNDVYGEMILTLAPIFFDERFYSLRTSDHEALLANLGRLCAQSISQPDAGLWEIRDGWQEHSFTNLMCWAGLERLERIRRAGFLSGLDLDLAGSKARAEQALRHAAREGSVRNGPLDQTFDSALAQMAVLRFPDRTLCEETLAGLTRELMFRNGAGETGFFYRYLRRDDFGHPASAFVICSFWVVQALARLGKLDEAKRIMESVSSAANHLGLFSEHYLPATGMQFGNFPQAYSHVGLINAAFAISPPWSEVL